MPFSGVSIWCGKEFRIQSIEVFKYPDILQWTLYPSEIEDTELQYYALLPASGFENDRTRAPRPCTSAEMLTFVNNNYKRVRVNLDCEDTRTVTIRWNLEKERWSGFQGGWDTNCKRLFVLSAEILKELILENKPWVFPNPGDTGYYQALEDSTAMNPDGTYNVAAIAGHRSVGDIKEYLVRWEDFHDDSPAVKDYTWETEASLVHTKALTKYKRHYGLS